MLFLPDFLKTTTNFTFLLRHKHCGDYEDEIFQLSKPLQGVIKRKSHECQTQFFTERIACIWNSVPPSIVDF